MEITFIIPNIEMSGGIRVIFEHANNLTAMGHKVSILHPIIPAYRPKWYNLRKIAGTVLGTIKNLKHNNMGWFDLKANLIQTRSLSEKYIPDADIIVATWWETAYYVKNYNKMKGEKFYLIQGYETWGGSEEEVHKTYKLGLHNIVVSNFLKNVIKKQGSNVEAVISNGFKSEEFFPESFKNNNKEIRILMQYRGNYLKGDKDGIEAFNLVKKEYPDVKLVMFGPKKQNNLPKDVEFHTLPSREKLRKIYNSCDIFMFSSHSEGFGLPPMEAMACKIPVVTTNVGAIPDYTIPRKTALISEPGNIKEMTDNVLELIKNDKKRMKIAEAGYQHIKNFTWDISTDQLEKIFKKYI